MSRLVASTTLLIWLGNALTWAGLLTHSEWVAASGLVAVAVACFIVVRFRGKFSELGRPRRERLRAVGRTLTNPFEFLFFAGPALLAHFALNASWGAALLVGALGIATAGLAVSVLWVTFPKRMARARRRLAQRAQSNQ
jgi:NhaP-type Na+/H+ or K+/H+ antiporter